MRISHRVDTTPKAEYKKKTCLICNQILFSPDDFLRHCQYKKHRRNIRGSQLTLLYSFFAPEFAKIDIMDDTHNTLMTLDQLADAYQLIQNQFNDAQVQVIGLHNELNITRNELNLTKTVLRLSNQIQVPHRLSRSSMTPSVIEHLFVVGLFM